MDLAQNIRDIFSALGPTEEQARRWMAEHPDWTPPEWSAEWGDDSEEILPGWIDMAAFVPMSAEAMTRATKFMEQACECILAMLDESGGE